MTTHSISTITPAANSRFACTCIRSWIVLLLVGGLGLIADLLSKGWAFAGTSIEAGGHNWIPPEPTPLVPFGLIETHLVLNNGAVFGFGADQRFFFITFTVAALVIGVLVFARFTRSNHRMAHVAIAFVLAGGVGNLYDRICFGVVRDFIHVLPTVPLPFGWQWPGGSPQMFPWVFNVADMMLLVGMALLLRHMNVRAAEKQAQIATTAIPLP